MKVVHCLGWYLPDSVGGTELYVRALASEQRRLGLEVAVMAPQDGEQLARYELDGIEVVRYPVPGGRSPEQHAGQYPHAAFASFESELARLGGQVFHLHSVTYGCGVHHLRSARRLGLNTVTTLHVAEPICARRTMMRYGRTACDGLIDPAQCVPCWLHAQGMPRALALGLARAIARAPVPLASHARGRLRTLLATEARVIHAREVLHEIASLSDRVVAVCRWLLDALVANALPSAKLVLCRQGVAPDGASDERRRRGPGDALRVGFFGRAARVKGLDTVVRAIRRLPPDCKVELRIHAPANLEHDRSYLDATRRAADGDGRIVFRPPLPPEAVQAAMRSCDAVVIPSRCLETGPLVALEALSAGVPVLASDLGGLRELIRPGIDGWLLPADDDARWAEHIALLARPGGLDLRPDPGRRAVTTTADVAARMTQLYTEIRA